MTTATPLPPPTTAPPAHGVAVEPAKKRRGLWIVLGVIAVLILAAIGTGAYFIAQGDDNAAPSTTTSVPDHEALAGEPGLVTPSGYTYGDPTSTDAIDFDNSMEQVNAQVAQAAPQLKSDFLTSWSIHEFTAVGSTEPIGDMALMQVNPKVMAKLPPAVTDTFVANMAGGMASGGATVTMDTIDGEDVAIAEGGEFAVYAWYHNGTVAMAFGSNQDDVQAFVEAFITTQNG